MMVKKMMMMMRTCDDVERVGGWGECGGGGDGERGVADHWHRVTPDHHYHYSDYHDYDHYFHNFDYDVDKYF